MMMRQAVSQSVLRLVAGTLLPVLTLASVRAQDAAPAEYICPMYCSDEVSRVAANCPVCRMEMPDRQRVENPPDHAIIFSKEAYQRMSRDTAIVVLDVRTEIEFRGDGYLKGAILIPVRELSARMDELEGLQGRTIIVYCSNGIRSARAAKMLTGEGHSAFSMLGGLVKWKREQLPVETHR